MNERRIARLEQQIKERVAVAVVQELNDPRLGFVTISRTKLDKEMQVCRVYWSVIGDEAQRKLSTQALDSATGYVRREVGKVLSTRTVPEIRFVYDEAVEGVQRMQDLLRELNPREDGDEGAEERPDPQA